MLRVLIAASTDNEGIRLVKRVQKAGYWAAHSPVGNLIEETILRDQVDIVVAAPGRLPADGSVLDGVRQRTTWIAWGSTSRCSIPGFWAAELSGTGKTIERLIVAISTLEAARDLEDRAHQLCRDLHRAKAESSALRVRLAEAAERDSVTGLLDHHGIYNRVQTMLRSAEMLPIATIVADMDGFRAYNDLYGRPVGNKLLSHIADALVQECPADADIARSAGDEFIAVLPRHTSHEAEMIVEQVRTWLRSHPFQGPNGGSVPIHLCFGIADSDCAGRSAVGLFAAADSALLDARVSGGDSTAVYTVEKPDTSWMGGSSWDVLNGLVTAIDNKDRYTRHHSEDVARYAVMLARELDLPEEVREVLHVASLLHDVGKIGVPDAILRKPGPLTADEASVMKTHVTLSTLLIHGLPRLEDILQAVANHHERWDGEGYPAGRMGMEIPLVGRIMGVADAFSAMTLDRPYRVGMSQDRALREMERGAGSQFDPELVPHFIRAIQREMGHLEVIQIAA
jgi:diguanylate cyclase (GGDEF)-like protein/putative nucleotidyltransferase with HDIG domain